MTTSAPAGTGPGDRESVTGVLKAAYDAFLYVGRPCSACHPERIATIATLMGLDAPDPATARVLDIGCGDGGNLVPMAAALPSGSFVGIDLSPRSIDEADALARDLGLSNIAFHAADLRDLPADAGTFDYIVAHGFYSWVPEPVRVALFETIRSRLSPRGVAFVSHNVLPGCGLRRMVWDVLKPHVAGIVDPLARIAAARAMAARMAEAMAEQPGLAAAIAIEFREIADRPGFGVLHDDLAPVNHPVLVRDLAAESARHGLSWLGDADLFRHVAPAFGPEMNAWLATNDRMTQEHVVDHVRLRRYRESLFVQEEQPIGRAPDASRLADMHVAATNSTVERHDGLQARATQSLQLALVDRLVDAHPGTVPVAELVPWIAGRAGAASPFTRPENTLLLLLNAAYAGVLVPVATAARTAMTPGEKPRAFAPARWQATRHDFVVNLRHDGVAFADPVMRRVLPLLDGTRDRVALVAALTAIAPGMRDPSRALDEYLAHFVKLGLLEA
ncbi:MAG: class I SAM-dependent methyltransferase [Betaproteobacteria bacterium]